MCVCISIHFINDECKICTISLCVRLIDPYVLTQIDRLDYRCRWRRR